MNLKYVSSLEDGQCPNPKCKEELMEAIREAVPKASVWKVLSVLIGTLLVPTLIGFAIVYSMITTADVKYAREVEVKVLAAQLGFVTTTMKDVKDSINDLNKDLVYKLEEIQKRQIEVYKALGTHREQSEKRSDNYGSRTGEATK